MSNYGELKQSSPDRLSSFNLSLEVKEVRVTDFIYNKMKTAVGVDYDERTGDMFWSSYPVVCDNEARDIDVVFNQSLEEIKGKV